MLGQLGCLADRLGIDRIVLVPFHERLHVSRRDQLYLMPKRGNFARPVMRATACLKRDNTARLRGEELQQLGAGQPPAEHHLPARIRAVRMKNSLRNIQPDRANLCHGRLLLVVINTSTMAHRCRRGASTWGNRGKRVAPFSRTWIGVAVPR